MDIKLGGLWNIWDEVERDVSTSTSCLGYGIVTGILPWDRKRR